MSQDDRSRWDERYRSGAYADRSHPSTYLVEHKSLLLKLAGRRAADLACGRGRNTRYLAALGFEVDGFDVSPVGIDLAADDSRRHLSVEASARVSWFARDLLESALPDGAQYDLILMIRFVAPDLLADVVKKNLRSGGLLLVEEHLEWSGSEQITGPGSNRFRVAPGTLGMSIAGMQIIHSHEGLVTEPDGAQAAVARIIARR